MFKFWPKNIWCVFYAPQCSVYIACPYVMLTFACEIDWNWWIGRLVNWLITIYLLTVCVEVVVDGWRCRGDVVRDTSLSARYIRCPGVVTARCWVVPSGVLAHRGTPGARRLQPSGLVFHGQLCSTASRRRRRGGLPGMWCTGRRLLWSGTARLCFALPCPRCNLSRRRLACVVVAILFWYRYRCFSSINGVLQYLFKNQFRWIAYW